jgi:hypothetical protein
LFRGAGTQLGVEHETSDFCGLSPASLERYDCLDTVGTGIDGAEHSARDGNLTVADDGMDDGGLEPGDVTRDVAGVIASRESDPKAAFGDVDRRALHDVATKFEADVEIGSNSHVSAALDQ